RLDIVETALTRVAAGMRPRKAAGTATADLSAARIVPMVARGVNWQPVVRSFCSTVDGFDCDSQRLTAAGLDDVILRTVVMMLRPELFLEHQWATRESRGFDLDPLMEQIVANLTGRVTLSDMEAWSGRTARAIQLAFKKRFGMGPMQWLRDKRLDLVRAKLLAAPAGATIRDIAASCGMLRMATLIPEYTSRFGERPSDTLRRAGSTGGSPVA
ncbi:MAG: helix-turn-helix domain-containing protein, partial [Pirellulales bacterium]